MPIDIGPDVRVTEVSSEPFLEELPDWRFQAARRMSRMTQFITQVKEEDNIEMESDELVKALKKYNKRKKNKASTTYVEQKEKIVERLTLVWKPRDEFIIPKKPQTCLEELMAHKATHKTQLIFQKHHRKVQKNSKHSSNLGESISNKPMKPKPTPVKSNCEGKKMDKVRKESMLSITSDQSSVCTVEKNQWEVNTLTTARTTSERKGSLPQIYGTKQSTYASTASLGQNKEKQYLRGGRRSKNLFSTKKDTGNEECYMHINSVLTAKETSLKKLQITKTETEKNIFRQSNLRPSHKQKTEELVPELKDRVSAEALVKAFISEQFLDMVLQGANAEKFRKLYNFTIMRQKTISDLIIKHPEILPTQLYKDLINYKKQFEVSPVYVSTPYNTEKSPWRDYFNKSLHPKGCTILKELENEIPLYANFYKTLIDERADNITIDAKLIMEERKPVLRDMIAHISYRLQMSRNTPGSPIRLEIMSVMAAAGYNDTLLIMLAQSVDSWLDQLAKCLGSNYKSIREETCQVLCYMTTCYPLMRALYISKYFDVVHDLVSILIRSMDTHEDTFDEYYITVAHLMHHTPSRGALDCIFDRLHLFKCVEMVRRWPKLVYYAFKYWPDDPLGVKSPLYGKRVVKVLENALQKPITYKFARAALYQFQLRYHNVSHIFTIFSDKAEKAYRVAFGLDD